MPEYTISHTAMAILAVRKTINDDFGYLNFPIMKNVKISTLPEFDVLIDCRSLEELGLFEEKFFGAPFRIGFGITNSG
jgi:hypothetical protein